MREEVSRAARVVKGGNMRKRIGHITKVSLIACCIALALMLVRFPGLPQATEDSGVLPLLKLGQADIQRIFTLGPSDAFAAGTVDFVTDGVADNVEFQAALNALPTVGGKLVVLAGNYNFAATVSRPINNVIIQGVGEATFFAWNAASPLFSVGTQTGWVFRDLRTDAGGITTAGSTAWTMQNVRIGVTYHAFRTAEGIGAAAFDIPVGRTATLVVAAHNSSPQSRAQADFVATGINDQVTLHKAMAALPAGGGKILLLEGSYNIGAKLTVNPNVTLEGVGWSSVIRQKGLANLILVIRAISGSAIHNLTLDFNMVNQTVLGVGLRMEDSVSVSGNRLLDAYTILERIGSHGRITNNLFTWSSAAAALPALGDAIGAYDAAHMVIANNTIIQPPWGQGIDLQAHSSFNTVIGNNIRGGHFGIDLNAAGGMPNHNTITGNVLDRVTEGIVHQGGLGNVITSNTISGSRIGIRVDGTHGIIHHTLIANNIIRDFEHLGIGFILAPSALATVTSNVIVGPVATVWGPPPRFGILFDGPQDRISLTNNTIKSPNNLSLQTGIEIPSGATNTYVAGNRFFGVFGVVPYRNFSTSTIDSETHSQLFMDTLATSTTHVSTARPGNSASQDITTGLTNPGVPRNLTVTSTNVGQALAGAIAEVGVTRTVETAAANNPTINDMTLLPAAPAVGNAYYFGNFAPTDRLTVNIGTGGAGVWTIVWEYWTGTTWVALTGVTDGTDHFRAAAGNRDVTFTVPADWAPSTIAGISAHWIRARLLAFTSMTVQPRGTQAWVGIYGIITITGLSARGVSTTDTILITRANAGTTVILPRAFATVSRFNIPAGVSSANTIAVGTGTRLGLSNIIYAAADVFKVKRNLADVPVGAVDVLNGTVDVGAIRAGDDFTIWYRSNLNIVR